MIEEKLQSIGITLSSPPQPLGSYVPILQSGNLIFVSGQIPLVGGALPEKYKGKVSSQVPITESIEASKQCTINAFEHMKKFLGDLERISKFVKVTGHVNSDPSFRDHPKVLNGASDFLLEIFGEKGRHTRVAIGVSSLPHDSVVEIDFLCEID
ncbi:MAG TPA: RidA family protein [Nitrososphaeraceae archaeon]|jgi:enamine deaminase RidA (YjgF/YER057c/UK114 family)|nr:RidA family protein [Nitrososphaeraceae archaeon]